MTGKTPEHRRENRQIKEARLTLQAMGVTLLGVFVSIGVTVALGLSASWWLRLLAGLATTASLAVGVRLLGTRTRLLARGADWVTGRSHLNQGDETEGF